MIEETGRVVAVDGGSVWLETVRQSGCASCSARSGCGQGLLSRLKDGQRNHLCLQTDMKLQVGDEVVLALPEQAFIRSSFLVYGLPLLTLVAAVLLADMLLELGEPGTIFAALVGLAAGFVGVRLLSQLASWRHDFQPIITRTISATVAD